MQNTGGKINVATAANGLPSARPVRWSLSGKVTLALVVILFCTLVVVAFFGYYKFESVYSSMVQSRYSFVVFSIKKRVEDSLNLGLPLNQIRQVQEIVEREKARDPRILAIEVFNTSGEILFDTDRGAIGLSVPARLRDSARAAAPLPFGAADEDTLIVGLPLVNTLGRVEGGVILRYPESYVRQGLAGTGGPLLTSLLIQFALFALLAMVGLRFLFARVNVRLERMEARLTQTAALGAVPADGLAEDDFEQRFNEFADKAREAVDHVREATDEVGRLDRLT